jgi:hypothetical protein
MAPLTLQDYRHAIKSSRSKIGFRTRAAAPLPISNTSRAYAPAVGRLSALLRTTRGLEDAAETAPGGAQRIKLNRCLAKEIAATALSSDAHIRLHESHRRSRLSGAEIGRRQSRS